VNKLSIRNRSHQRFRLCRSTIALRRSYRCSRRICWSNCRDSPGAATKRSNSIKNRTDNRSGAALDAVENDDRVVAWRHADHVLVSGRSIAVRARRRLAWQFLLMLFRVLYKKFWKFGISIFDAKLASLSNFRKNLIFLIKTAQHRIPRSTNLSACFLKRR